MTFRQKEFCKLYAKGHPAPEAARRAGYAKSTVETNAYRILNNPKAEARIRRLRGDKIVHRQDAEIMRLELLKTIRVPESQGKQIQACHALMRLQSLDLPTLEDEAELEDLIKRQARKRIEREEQALLAQLAQEMEESTQATPSTESTQTNTNLADPADLLSPQPPENQDPTLFIDAAKEPGQQSANVGAAACRPYETEDEPEIDTLPTGQPAFDINLSPQKTPPQKPEPIQIEIIDIDPINTPLAL